MLKVLMALGVAFAASQEPADDTLEKLHAYIVPKGNELKWREIAWRPVFLDAVIEAQQKDMPVLLWGMNGHPLACT